MGDLADGETTQVKGSGSAVYTLKNSGGVYSCTCPAWMHQGSGIERRTCKHLRAFRGDDAEKERLGSAELTGKPRAGGAEGEAAEPPLLLAHKWEVDVDLTGWWLSEKLDGVRAYWDGTKFLSRLGNEFYPPPWFTEALPKTPLDGELWGGRKLFQRTVGIVKRQDRSPLWKELLYVVFDAPSREGAFEERIAHCESVLGSSATYARVHTHVPCRGLDHLREELARVESLGGEGLMARKPKSRYEAGRSSTLLKVKTFKDAEARVVGHVPGAGRHKGRLGALLVELADGTRFNVGTGLSDREREDPPEVGALVTFRYQELSDGGVPRFPSFVAERFDASGPSALSGEKPQRKGRRFEISGKDTLEEVDMARYEFIEGTSKKFWEIALRGTSFTTTFGRIGTDGQTSTKDYDSKEQAKKEYDKLIAEKTKKGYELVSGNGAAPAAAKKGKAAVIEDEAPPKGKKEKAVAKPAAKSGASKSGKSGARYFELVDGSSSKFWEIKLDGSSFTTRFGRIGTDGQSSEKDFDSKDQAKKEYDKLVAEKTKKGYVER
jgi:DNA ligase-1